MKTLGMILAVVGCIWGIVAFNMGTTVATESRFIGDSYIPSREVHNIGMMDAKRNHLMLAAVLAVVGVILFVGGKSGSGNLPTQESTATNEGRSSRPRFTGKRDISEDSYQLFLTKQHLIELNHTLGKYVVGESLHKTLEDALSHADRLESEFEKLFMYQTEERYTNALRVVLVKPDSEAARIGMQPEDIILSFGDGVVSSDESLSQAIFDSTGKDIVVAVLRNGRTERLPVNWGGGKLGVDTFLHRLDNQQLSARIDLLQGLPLAKSSVA